MSLEPFEDGDHPYNPYNSSAYHTGLLCIEEGCPNPAGRNGAISGALSAMLKELKGLMPNSAE
jgi:hypothetical protein